MQKPMKSMSMNDAAVLHLCDKKDNDRYYEVSLWTLFALKNIIKDDGIVAAWSWFLEQRVERVDERANHTLDTYFLDWGNPNESSEEWEF